MKCDATSWDDQVHVFQAARERSPNGGIDIVIANAGIYGPDVLEGMSYSFSKLRIFALQPRFSSHGAGLEGDEPKRPDTKLLDVNLIGVMYTANLAIWHFHHQELRDGCLILNSSIMGYIDTQGSSVYSAAKHGVRGLMTCLRRKGVVRVNSLAPWCVSSLS